MSCKFCHDCAHMVPANGTVRCAKGHKLKYKYPDGSTDSSYGLHAVGGCGKSFVKRTADYYQNNNRPGRKPKQAYASKGRA